MIITGKKCVSTSEKVYPAELRELLEKGSRGDKTVLPALKKAFDDNPEMVSIFGNLARHAEECLLDLATGTCLAAREAIARQLVELRTRLSATTTTEVEKLLVDRVAISHLEVYHADIDLVQHLRTYPGSSPAVKAAERRLDRAHNRYMSAIRTLAAVTKLLRPLPSPVDLLQRMVAETPGPARRGKRSNRVADDVLVLN